MQDGKDSPEAMATGASGPLTATEHAGQRIVAFDGLRGVAAIMVLLHHCLLMLPVFANYQWFHTAPARLSGIEFLLLRTPLRLVWAGQERAILFFVLSGFVLSLPWLKGRPLPYGRFLAGRFCRIYPPYLVAMAFAAAGSILLGGHPIPGAGLYYNALGWAGRPGWNSLTSVLAVLTNRHSEYMNEAVWSLTWEVRIAFLFPLLMLAVTRLKNRGIALLYASLLGGQHLAGHLAPGGHPGALDLAGQTCLYAQFFVLGTAIALNRGIIAAWFGRRPASLGWACLAIGLVVCWAPWPRLHAELVGAGAAAIMVAILGSPALGRWLAAGPWLWLGRQSYSLYLIHVPIVMATIVLFQGKVPLLACLAVIPAAIGCAELFHRWIELPSVALAQALLLGKPRARPSGFPDPAFLDTISPDPATQRDETRTAA
jgi:peptidoglycan/LPS O-acetylase OafA/YrhL